MANSKNILNRLGLPQSYTSLILGSLVVIVAIVLVFGIIRRGAGFTPSITPPDTSAPESQFTQEKKELPANYTIAQGDTLWSISEKFYKSGYNWVDITKENNLQNPDVLFVGTTLKIPNVEPKMPQVENQPNAITGTSYTVVQDDNLWDVAVRAYGDGYKWVDIAKANNLVNPDVIDVGQALTIPR